MLYMREGEKIKSRTPATSRNEVEKFCYMNSQKKKKKEKRNQKRKLLEKQGIKGHNNTAFVYKYYYIT